MRYSNGFQVGGVVVVKCYFVNVYWVVIGIIMINAAVQKLRMISIIDIIFIALNAISLRGAGLGCSLALARSLVAVIKEVKPEMTPRSANIASLHSVGIVPPANRVFMKSLFSM